MRNLLISIKRICRQLLEKQASATYNLVELAEKLEIVQSEKVARKLGGDWTAAIAAHQIRKSVRIFSNAVSFPLVANLPFPQNIGH